MPGKVSWTFTDLATSTTYILEVNPNAGGAPQRQKNVTTRSTLAPGGNKLTAQGMRLPDQYEWSGVLLNQVQHEAFITWWQKKHQIMLTDDLGRVSFVYITDYTSERGRASRSPWKHTYTMKATKLDY